MTETITYVAIVDDDESFARAVSRLLRAAGYEALLYSSAERFLAALPPSSATCLLLDMHLGGMSGLELQQKLVALGSRLPIIFVTADRDAETRERALQAGCVAYLRKPVPKAFLFEAIQKAASTGPSSEPKNHQEL